jgi:hypothetical protein
MYAFLQVTKTTIDSQMSIMTALWSISFPIGMVLGLSKYVSTYSGEVRAQLIDRSKYHVPLQVINIVFFYFARHFGHHHGGRQFPSSVHGVMATIVTWIVFIASPSFSSSRHLSLRGELT